jgi:hypothetical protein
MLVILIDNQLVSPQKVCPGCLLADQSGEPRWREGRLCCGHAVRKTMEQQPDQYECKMGFRVANVE